jgi:hypothetical protein
LSIPESETPRKSFPMASLPLLNKESVLASAPVHYKTIFLLCFLQLDRFSILSNTEKGY